MFFLMALPNHFSGYFCHENLFFLDSCEISLNSIGVDQLYNFRSTYTAQKYFLRILDVHVNTSGSVKIIPLTFLLIF